MKKKKLLLKDSLFHRVMEIFAGEKRGRVLDLGCGNGAYAAALKRLGFDVVAADGDDRRFRCKDDIELKVFDISEKFPFSDAEFDYVLFLETIEHLWEPDHSMKEISRILKRGGSLVVSTPNILNINSRLRFLFEGAFDYFREPTLDYVTLYPENFVNVHVIPWRYQDLEYLLFVNGLTVKNIHTDILRGHLRFPCFALLPIIQLQHFLKQRRFHKKGGIDYGRIQKILTSDEILYGKHLILKAEKAGEILQSRFEKQTGT